MTALRRTFLICGALLMTIFVAACGIPGMSGGNTGTVNNNMTATQTPGHTTLVPSTNNAKATPTTAPMHNTMATPTTAANTNMNMNAFVNTTTVTINGNKVNVLTTNKGFILYYYMKDTMLTSNCTGMCAQTWPPLLAPSGMMTVNSSMMLPKQLSVHMTANGQQVFYDGHALYTYIGDKQAGQFTGRGIGNAWYLVGFTL